MAKIKKIIRGNPISSFKKVSPDGGGAFRLLAVAMNEAYDRVEPVATKAMQDRGAELGRAEARRKIGERAPVASAARVSTSDVSWLKYSNKGAIRNQPISRELENSLSFLSEMGVTMDVISGGQESNKKGEGTGSTRHNHGGSADADFYKDGRKLVSGNPADEAILSKIVTQAKANGVTGFGEGEDYMGAGRLHLGFGNPSVWGKGGKGSNAPAWLKAAYNAAPAGSMPQQPTISSSNVEPTVIRNSAGELESQMYSPYSGPILQAHNAAAQVAYQSEMLNQGAVDIMQMSSDFPLNPDGFNEAAQGYVESIVEQAPDQFKSDLRGVLEGEIRKRASGMMVERQRDIRARSNNSSRALMERQQTYLAEAIASGDAEEIEAARLTLDGTLQAREALPGVAWTEEQSVNVFLKAQSAADRLTASRQKVKDAEYKDIFGLIIKSAENGRTAEGEDILSNPDAIASNPELAREAAAFVSLRDNMPSFLQMTPQQQAEALASVADGTVSEEWELDVLAAATKAAKANRKAWEDDPMKRAGEVLTDPPPPLPQPTLEDGQAFLEAFAPALSDRREYGNKLVDSGYTDKAAFFTENEAESLAAMMGKETPPEIRAAMASAIVAGFGPDAVKVFGEINADPVTMFAGKVMAVGGRPVIAAEMLRGQQILDEGMVKIPAKLTSKVVSPKIAGALRGIPNELGAQKELMEAAKAIYAARAQGQDLDDAQSSKLMESSMQTALGQSQNKRGELTGGVQEIMGRETLLPVGVSGKGAEAAMDAAFGVAYVPMAFSKAYSKDGVNEEMWAAAGGGVPMVNGSPVPSRMVTGENLRLISAGGSNYRMEIVLSGTTLDAEDENGNVFFFDLNALMEAAP